MVFVAATFIVVVALVVGNLLGHDRAPRGARAGKLHKRLRTSLGTRAGKRIDFVKEVEKLSAVKAFDAVLARTSGVASSLQRLIAQADMQMTVGRPGARLGVLLSRRVADRRPGSRAALARAGPRRAAGVRARIYVVKHKAARRLRTFEEQFPEAIDLIARALRAGHGFTTGLAIVAEEAPQPVAGEFRLLYDQQNFGMPLGDALKAFAERIPLLDARFFVTAVLTQRESGGNLAEILGNLADRHPRALQGEAPGAGDLGARTHHRLGAVGTAAVARDGVHDHVAEAHA